MLFRNKATQFTPYANILPLIRITRENGDEKESYIRRFFRFPQVQDQSLVSERLSPKIQQQAFAKARGFQVVDHLSYFYTRYLLQGFQFYDHRAVADKISSIKRVQGMDFEGILVERFEKPQPSSR